MRVVAGSVRGRTLVAPTGDRTRPTGDRVREAMFNSLGSLDALRGATVVDLFAGSGALGIEALSRGAEHCTFVERDRSAVTALSHNLRVCGFEARSTVMTSDVMTAVAHIGHADLVLADPPYSFDRWADLLAAVDSSLFVLESDRELEPARDWDVLRSRRYGRAVVTILTARTGGHDHNTLQCEGASK